MIKTSQAELEARRAVLLRQFKTIGPVIEGSLAIVKRRCGKPGCRCGQGPAHEAVILCRKVAGRSYATYVPVGMRAEVRRWNAEHKRVKKLLKLISELNEQIVRVHVTEKRQQAKRRTWVQAVERGSREA